MPRQILLTGATGFLGAYLVLELLRQTDADVFCLVRAEDDAGARRRLLARLEALVARYGSPDGLVPRALARRVHAVAGSLADADSLGDAIPARIDEIWHSAAALQFDERSRGPVFAANVDGTRSLLALAHERGVGRFHHVSTAYVAGERTGVVPEGPADASFAAGNPYEESKREAERLVVAACGTGDMHFRIFRPSIVMGDSRDHRAESDSSAYGFANSVAALKSEICSRMPDYFRLHPLRLLGAEGHVLNFVAADRAAHVMVRLAESHEAADRWFHVVNPADTSLSEICRIIGETNGVELRVLAEEATLNPLDMLLRARTSTYNCYLTNTKHFESSAATAAGVDPETLALSLHDLRRFFEEHRKGRAAELVEKRGRMRKALTQLERRDLPRADGRNLTYFVGGRGARTLVIVNAFGQSLYFWNWFILRFFERRRIVLWQARGTDLDYGFERPFRLGDQADDLAAILDHESLSEVDVIGWCTGPKVALEFYRRRPSRVRSLVFLTGAFKPMTGFEALQTAYEESMEPLCRAIDEHPAAAGTVMEALKSIVAGRAPGADQLDLRVADVLALVAEELRGLVIGPFLDTGNIVRYARQLLDFWQFDVSEGLRAIAVPTLFIGAEHDSIASPAISRAAAMQCPGSHYVEILGGTHFSMFENHELIAELVEAFLLDPARFRFDDAQVRASRGPLPAADSAIAAAGAAVDDGATP